MTIEQNLLINQFAHNADSAAECAGQPALRAPSMSANAVGASRWHGLAPRVEIEGVQADMLASCRMPAAGTRFIR
jgi:hypothetical protein